MAGEFDWEDFPKYVTAQCVGAILAGAVLFLIASGKADFAGTGGFASNGYGDHSSGKFSMFSALVTEIVMTAFFLLIILGATAGSSVPGFAPIAIGMALVLIHLISIRVTNTSVSDWWSQYRRRTSSRTWFASKG